ncbi:hypothetical protein [Trujillonella humicola]|uniref:hypothetical protein n=1 Tax=Trujillonella humicola TaxID=3383699 RepID=UPI0039059539
MTAAAARPDDDPHPGRRPGGRAQAVAAPEEVAMPDEVTVPAAAPRSPGAPEAPDEDEYSPAFAAWALLLTVLVLASLVGVLWALGAG